MGEAKEEVGQEGGAGRKGRGKGGAGGRGEGRGGIEVGGRVDQVRIM